jgi:hypothetical protein
VDVLDDQDEGPPLGEALKQRQNLLEQASTGEVGVAPAVWMAEGREQPAQLTGLAPREQLPDAVRADIPDQPAQRGRERREREAVLAQLQAPSRENPRPTTQPGGELGDQAGLPDPGVPADQDGGRAFAGVRERLRKCGELAVSAHEDSAQRARAHAPCSQKPVSRRQNG